LNYGRKIPEVIKLKQKKFTYVHSFGGFMFMLVGSFSFGAMIRQYIMMGVQGRGSSLWYGDNK
jgi:hypothetical protein